MSATMRFDGQVEMYEVKTGKPAVMWGVDARQAERVGSHTREKPEAAAPAPKGAAAQAPPKPDTNASVTAPTKP